MNKVVILASRSPRRTELLNLCGVEHIIMPADIKETMDESLPLDLRMQKLAYDKALPIAKAHPDEIVIGADTIVYIDGTIIGKARNLEDARRILKSLSGRTHEVLTGVCVLYKKQRYTFTTHSEVTFCAIEKQDLEDYLALNEWQGKAGAYAIQGQAVRFIEKINGDYSNIVGLPVVPLLRILKSLKND